MNLRYCFHLLLEQHTEIIRNIQKPGTKQSNLFGKFQGIRAYQSFQLARLDSCQSLAYRAKRTPVELLCGKTLHTSSTARDSLRASMWVCLKIVYPYTQWLMIIIPTKWRFHWGYTPFSDRPMLCGHQSLDGNRIWCLVTPAAEFSRVSRSPMSLRFQVQLATPRRSS